MPPVLRGRSARIDLHLADSIPRSSQGTYEPYAQFEDKKYEIGDIKSTTNLTTALSGGHGPMSDSYDEVTTPSIVR